MDERLYFKVVHTILPYFAPAEQAVYMRLWRLSVATGQEFCHARYLELCEGANVSVSTLKRALAGLRAKGLVTVQWNAKRESLFTVATKSLAPQKKYEHLFERLYQGE